MQDDGLELLPLDVDELDASDLGGTGEYSATGGGSQPLHDPRRASPDDDEELLDVESLREMYRWSLGRATQDAAPGRLERWVDGPLHVEDPRHGR